MKRALTVFMLAAAAGFVPSSVAYAAYDGTFRAGESILSR